MLPEAVSEALGTSLSKVLNLYFGELNDVERGHFIGNAIDRRRTAEEGEGWLAEEAHRRDLVTKLVHHGGDDMF
jgi:hypothetical protein